MKVQSVQKEMEIWGLDAIVLFSPVNIRYLSRFEITDGAAVITRDRARMFTDSRFIEAARAQADELEVELFGGERPLMECVKEALEGCAVVGAEEQYLPYGDWQRWEKRLARSFTPAEALLKKLRAVKEPYETESIIAAQRIAEAAFDEVLGLIRPGMTERELAAELSINPNPIQRAYAVLQAGDFVTMDFGCLKNGYCSDMTRTVALGYATDEMRAVYDTVLRAQLAGIEIARAGVTGAQVHNAGAKVIEDAGWGDYFGHSFGHSVGLEIHEAPNASPANQAGLPAGAIITAEPGIYIPGKFGVRIEDMIYITGTGCVNLTRAPKELLVI